MSYGSEAELWRSGGSFPLLRPIPAVMGDLLCGNLTLEQAEHHYGVVLDPETGMLDKDRTAFLRGPPAKSS